MGDKKNLFIGLAVAASVLLSGALIWQMSRSKAAPEAGSQAAAVPAGSADVQKTVIIPPPPVADLAHSDDALREKAKGLSGLPLFAQWLKTEDVVRRLAAAVFCVCDGTSPRESLSFLSPRKKFSAKKVKGVFYVDPKSYSRYDVVASVVDSIDPQAAAAVVQALDPYFQAASAELGTPARPFQATLVKAITNLLKTPVVERDIPLKEKVVSFAIAPMPDLDLESLNAAQKHLLRMGPKNTVKIQARLRAMALALGAPADQLPQQRIYSAK